MSFFASRRASILVNRSSSFLESELAVISCFLDIDLGRPCKQHLLTARQRVGSTHVFPETKEQTEVLFTWSAAVLVRDSNSKVAQHANQFVHSVDLDHATIVDKASNFHERLFKTAFWHFSLFFSEFKAGINMKAVFCLGITFLSQISRSRLKRSRISMLISHIYVLGRFVNFW